jgi:hypothetical protein
MLRTSFGIGVQMSSQSRLELPGTGPVALHDASVVGTSASTSSAPSPSQESSADVSGAGRASDVPDVAWSARLSGREGE